MLKRSIKGSILAFTIGILFSASVTVAVAATGTSPWYYYGPYQGYSYQNSASVTSSYPNGVWADTHVKTQSGATVPAGYMAAWSGLYNSSGQLLQSSGKWLYNLAPLAYMGISSDEWLASGAFYSKGYTAAYNGNGYNTFNTYQSPSINY